MHSIRPMSQEDLDQVAAIQGPDSPWKPENYLLFDAWVLVTDEVAGFLVTRSVYLDEEFEILNLAVGVEHRRKGYARLLLETAIQRHPGIWFLEVRTTNEPAIELYKSLSFKESGVRKDYYQNPTEDGIVMVRKA